MDILKDVLLVFTVVLLVYVLYQRLLQVLGKKERSRRYAAVSETMDWEGRSLKMHIEAEQAMVLQVTVCTPAGDEVIRLEDRSLEVGKHDVVIECHALVQGRYYVSLQTPAQEYSRYFEIEA